MRRASMVGVVAVTALLSAVGATLAWLNARTHQEVADLRASLLAAAAPVAASATRPAGAAEAGGVTGPQRRDGWAALPPPVQRCFAFTFGAGSLPDWATVEMDMQGQFRRPRTTAFQPTTARQLAGLHRPELVFDATTPMLPGVWAVAYDAFVHGRMTMKAKVWGAVQVVNEGSFSSPELDRISLRRWLMEAPTYPMALLPGGPVHWEAVDEQQARAVVVLGDVRASALATFAADGRLLSMDAEVSGNLDSPYHGSGEYASRDDYRWVQGVRVPMAFSFARSAAGQRHPFWEGRITRITFRQAGG